MTWHLIHKKYSRKPSPFWKANRFLVKKFPAFYATRRFITPLTKTRHLSLFLATTIQTMPPYPNVWRSTLVLSFHLQLGFSHVYHQNLYAHLFVTRATCTAHLMFLDFITRVIFGEEYRAWSFSLCSRHISPGTSSILGLNILVSIPFWNAFRLCFSKWEIKSHTHIKQQPKLLFWESFF